VDIAQTSKLPPKGDDLLWPAFLDNFSDLVCAYYWSFGLKETARFSGCSESTITKTIDRWDKRKPEGHDRVEPPSDSPTSKIPEEDRLTTPSQHIKNGIPNESHQYWRGRHDGFREGILMGIDIVSGALKQPKTKAEGG